MSCDLLLVTILLLPVKNGFVNQSIQYYAVHIIHSSYIVTPGDSPVMKTSSLMLCTAHSAIVVAFYELALSACTRMKTSLLQRNQWPAQPCWHSFLRLETVAWPVTA